METGPHQPHNQRGRELGWQSPRARSLFLSLSLGTGNPSVWRLVQGDMMGQKDSWVQDESPRLKRFCAHLTFVN